MRCQQLVDVKLLQEVNEMKMGERTYMPKLRLGQIGALVRERRGRTWSACGSKGDRGERGDVIEDRERQAARPGHV